MIEHVSHANTYQQETSAGRAHGKSGKQSAHAPTGATPPMEPQKTVMPLLFWGLLRIVTDGMAGADISLSKRS